MFDPALTNLSHRRGCMSEAEYIAAVKSCIGSIARLPNGSLKGHVERVEIKRVVTALITELEAREQELARRGPPQKPAAAAECNHVVTVEPAVNVKAE